MPAFLYNIPSSIPGSLTRGEGKVEDVILDSSNHPTAFGTPVVIDATSHKLRGMLAPTSLKTSSA